MLAGCKRLSKRSACVIAHFESDDVHMSATYHICLTEQMCYDALYQTAYPSSVKLCTLLYWLRLCKCNKPAKQSLRGCCLQTGLDEQGGQVLVPDTASAGGSHCLCRHILQRETAHIPSPYRILNPQSLTQWCPGRLMQLPRSDQQRYHAARALHINAHKLLVRRCGRLWL